MSLTSVSERLSAKLRWVLKPKDEDRVAKISEQLGISKVIATILSQRITGDIDEVKKFMNPRLTDMLPPSAMRDMDIGAKRIAQAIRQKERIIIFGDYDADGVTATAVLLSVFKSLHANVSHYLPSRMEEGYGLSQAFVDMAITEKVGLIVTVDCGTSEIDKIKSLMDAGVDVIVTDHHEPGGQDLPAALAVINPKRDDASYPFRELTGAGVAFKVAWGVCQEMAGSEKVGDTLQSSLLSVLPFVAIGTIADVAPMIGENRVMVSYGLKHIGDTPGLSALLDVARVNPKKASSRDIGFAVAPRINAAGRLGEAELALKLLVEQDSQKAATLAKELDDKNKERQALCQKTLKDARAIVEREYDVGDAPVLVVCADEWHEGVIGIVAGRLSDDYNLPVAVISFNAEGKGKGSARGVSGLNLYEAINYSRERMITFGGHEQAAGFSIDRSEVEAFKAEITEQCREQIRKRRIEPKMEIDCEVDLTEVNDSMVRELAALAPFGEGNKQPTFLCKGVRVSGTPRLMGRDDQHFTFNASQNRTAYRAVVFNNTAPLEAIDSGRRSWDIVFSLNFNDYYEPPRLELRVRDMRPLD